MNSRTEHDPDKSSKKPKHNAWRAYQAFKNLSEIQLNKGNEHKKKKIESLRKDLWSLREELVESENPFLVKEDLEEVEEDLYG